MNLSAANFLPAPSLLYQYFSRRVSEFSCLDTVYAQKILTDVWQSQFQSTSYAYPSAAKLKPFGTMHVIDIVLPRHVPSVTNNPDHNIFVTRPTKRSL